MQARRAAADLGGRRTCGPVARRWSQQNGWRTGFVERQVRQGGACLLYTSVLDSALSSVFGTADSLVASVSAVQFLMCCAASIVLGAAVACIYMFRHKYSKNFVVTLAPVSYTHLRLEADRVVKAQVAAQELIDEAPSGAAADVLQLTGDGLAKYEELFAPAGALLPEELWAPTGRGLLLALQDAWRTGAADPLDCLLYTSRCV